MSDLRKDMIVYLQFHLWVHGKAISLLLSFDLLPFSSWKWQVRTPYRLFRIHGQRQFGPLKIEWFDRRTRYEA